MYTYMRNHSTDYNRIMEHTGKVINKQKDYINWLETLAVCLTKFDGKIINVKIKALLPSGTSYYAYDHWYNISTYINRNQLEYSIRKPQQRFVLSDLKTKIEKEKEKLQKYYTAIDNILPALQKFLAAELLYKQADEELYNLIPECNNISKYNY